ncbi:DUF6286 domain-containing protein [Amycolatopsis thermoflava]|uniref:DUF6286 domain-containing protein n=1 Tax=Amycolatopsis thermoflava TaxID=84480 RepID=UPI0003F5B214|nr:DUF6286 domain-containing protein [Amycolatopsis thermoflava]
MKRRPRRCVPATLVALVLLAASVLVTITALQMLLHAHAWIDYGWAAHALHDLRWADTTVLLAGLIVAAMGVLLVLCAFVPGPRTVLSLAADDTNIDSGASRRSYRSTLRAAAEVDGVKQVKLKLRDRSVKALVHTERTNTAGLAETVEQAVAHRLDQIAPAPRPAVNTRVKAARSQ